MPQGTGNAVRSALYLAADGLFGGDYAAIVRDMDAFQRLDPGEIRERQWSRLERLLRHAHDTVPYYRDLLDAAGLRPDKVTPEIYAQVPILTKKTLRENMPDRIVSRAALGSRRPIVHRTSGSTGFPLTVYSDPGLVVYDRASAVWHRHQTGLGRGDRIISFFNRRHARSRVTRIWHGLTGPRYAPPELALAGDGPALAAFLNRWRPAGIAGLPALHKSAVQAMLAGGHRLAFRPKVVSYQAEAMEPEVQDQVREFYGAPLFSRYGAAEFSAPVALTCAEHARQGGYAHERMHVNAYGHYVEIVDDEGRPARPGEVGRIIVTDLWNRVMPLIRYEIADLGSLGAGRCECGRGLPVLTNLAGRVPASLVLPSGKPVSQLRVQSVLRDEKHRFSEFQVQQPEPGKMVVAVVPKPEGYPREAAAALEQRYREFLGEPMEVEVRLVESIPLERSGKRPSFRSLQAYERDEQTT